MTPKKVLMLIEDEPGTRLVLKRRLTAHRFDILEAKDGVSGVALAKKAQPDLIVLDIMLPGKNGFEVYRELKCKPATRGIPILFLTALSGGHSLAKKSIQLLAFSRSGLRLEEPYAVLGKPYDPQLLVNEIRQLLKEPPLPADENQPHSADENQPHSADERQPVSSDENQPVSSDENRPLE